MQIGDGVSREERDTEVREPKQVARQGGDEVEDIIPSLCAEHKQCDDELREHAANDSMPADLAAVATRCPEQEDHDSKTKEGDGAVATCVVGRFRGDEGCDEHNCNGYGCCGPEAQFLWDQLVDSDTGVVPGKVHGLGHDGNGGPEEDDAKSDGEVEEEGDQPAVVVTVQDEACYPPAACC